MSILKLTPSCKDYLWGGSRLRTDFGVQSDLNPLAEAWVLSCHPDGPSYLPDGTMLADYLAAHPEAAGTDCKKFEMFPVLTKFIDAKESISIQVHPSNEYALEHEHQYGKTEMWYVLDCEPGAFLYYGFDHEISREELEERIRNNTLTEVLNAVPVKKGDCFFIPSGTLHAICKGVVVVEVQQNSNVTYRVYGGRWSHRHSGRDVLCFAPDYRRGGAPDLRRRNGAGKKGRQFLYHGGQRCLCFNGQLQSPADNRLIITKAE